MSVLERDSAESHPKFVRKSHGPVWRFVVWVCAVGVLVIAGLGADSVWGSGPSVKVLSGEVYSSGFQAQTKVDGWEYNVPLAVPWFSSNGGFVEGETAPCVADKGLHPITFGYVPVTHDSVTWRQVVWVSCSEAVVLPVRPRGA